MIKIKSITNHHQWDGKILTTDQFNKLQEMLLLSIYTYNIEWEYLKESKGDV